MPIEQNLQSCSWLTETEMTFYTSVVRDATASKNVFNEYGIR